LRITKIVSAFASISLVMLAGAISPASAQTHPCDVTTPTTYQVRRDQSVRVAFCHTQQEDDGTPIALGQIRFRVVNASTQALIVDLGLLTPLTGPNAAGAYYFESSSRFFTADVNLLVSAEFNAVVVPSTPILVDVRGGPKAPISPRVVLQ
jgi:hypothetical protein